MKAVSHLPKVRMLRAIGKRSVHLLTHPGVITSCVEKHRYE